MRLERVRRDGRALVVKHTAHPADLEAEGLAALADAGALVPEVVEVAAHRLVMEDLDASAPGPPSREEWTRLGERLATVHRTTADRFGWHRDNVIGTITQHNTPAEDWPTFHQRCRIDPWLGALPTEVADRLRAAEGELARRLDHDVEPSLLHGDLWAGNVMHGRWLIDPRGLLR
ncbi:fructosamine kinase family protein [Salsipaludibacter albus]|uniref:fructosamine kinase family protein n=1 Tax=Salsipaludibacter albus TaxID=2849650 RepID=UPI002367503D|nr:fructosamine kinase family protein [Salsipaludibacter albus]